MTSRGHRGRLTVRLVGFLCHPPPLSRGGPLCRHQTARGGLTTHPFPGACVQTSTHPDTVAVVSLCGKWRLPSGLALSPSGPLPPLSAMEASKVLWQWRRVTDGGFIVASPGQLVILHRQCRRGPTGWRRWRPSPLRANPMVEASSSAGALVDGATGARPLCAPRHRSSHLIRALRHRDVRIASGWRQDSVRMTSGWRQDGIRMASGLRQDASGSPSRCRQDDG